MGTGLVWGLSQQKHERRRVWLLPCGSGLCGCRNWGLPGQSSFTLLLPYPVCGQTPACDFPAVFPLLSVKVGFVFLSWALVGAPKGSSESWAPFAAHPVLLSWPGKEEFLPCLLQSQAGGAGSHLLTTEITEGARRSCKPKRKSKSQSWGCLSCLSLPQVKSSVPRQKPCLALLGMGTGTSRFLLPW